MPDQTVQNLDPILVVFGKIELMSAAPWRYRLHIGNERVCEPIDYDEDQLLEIDTRLPAVLRTMFDSHIVCRRTVPTLWLHNTLAYMDNPVHIKNKYGREHVLKEVTGYTISKDCTDIVLTAQVYDYFVLTPQPYITGSDELDMTVSPEELERVFPGWHARYLALYALDGSGTEYLKGMFGLHNHRKTRAQTADLSGITFE